MECLIGAAIYCQFGQNSPDQRSEFEAVASADRDQRIRILGKRVEDEISVGCQGIQTTLGVDDRPQGGRLVFDFTVLEVLDERMASLRLISYVPAPGTGTREKMEALLRAPESIPESLEIASLSP
jgi:hypothetical protein